MLLCPALSPTISLPIHLSLCLLIRRSLSLPRKLSLLSLCLAVLLSVSEPLCLCHFLSLLTRQIYSNGC